MVIFPIGKQHRILSLTCPVFASSDPQSRTLVFILAKRCRLARKYFYFFYINQKFKSNKVNDDTMAFVARKDAGSSLQMPLTMF